MARTTPPAAAESTPARLPVTVRGLLGGNVLWLSIVSLLNDTASEMIYPLLPFFLVTTLGAGPTFLGLIEGIADSTSSFVKLVSGWLSDRMSRRKPLVVAGYGMACAARPLIAVAAAPWHVLAIRFSDRVGKGMRSAPRDALLAESVAIGARGRAFGVHRAADHTGAVLGPLLAALLLALAADLRLVFALAAVPGLAVVTLLVWRVRDVRGPAEQLVAETPSLHDTGTAFRRYLIVLAIFTLGNATDAFLLLRAGELGVPVAALPLLWGLHHASKAGWSVPGGVLADRFGASRAIVVGWLIYAATYAAFAGASAEWHAWALFAVYGIYYGLTEAPEKVLVAELARQGRRGAAFGAYHFTVGVAALPASVLFGVLWSRFGAPVAFLAGAALALLAAVLLPFALPRRASGDADAVRIA